MIITRCCVLQLGWLIFVQDNNLKSKLRNFQSEEGQGQTP